MGQSSGRGISSGVYLDTAREIRERQYMKVERKIWIFKEPELTTKERETSKELRKELQVERDEKYQIQKENDKKFARLEQLIDEKWKSSKKESKQKALKLEMSHLTEQKKNIVEKVKEVEKKLNQLN